MLPHGPDTNAFEKASTVELVPQKLTNTLAFMFETRYPQHVTAWAVKDAAMQANYQDCWTGLKRNFTGKPL
jgi:homogentisate 1,2-dioxygenase